jgi:hypothetical protein
LSASSYILFHSQCSYPWMSSNPSVLESLNNLLVGFHVLLSLNGSSQLILRRCSLICIASLTSWSMQPDVLASTLVIWNLIRMLCSATVIVSGCYKHRCQVCFLHLVSMDRPVCPIYTFPHTHGML